MESPIACLVWVRKVTQCLDSARVCTALGIAGVSVRTLLLLIVYLGGSSTPYLIGKDELQGWEGFKFSSRDFTNWWLRKAALTWTGITFLWCHPLINWSSSEDMNIFQNQISSSCFLQNRLPVFTCALIPYALVHLFHWKISIYSYNLLGLWKFRKMSWNTTEGIECQPS